MTIHASPGRPPTECHSGPSIQQGKRDDPTVTRGGTNGSSQQGKHLAEQALRSVRLTVLRTDRHAPTACMPNGSSRRAYAALTPGREDVRDVPVVPRWGVRGEDASSPRLAAACSPWASWCSSGAMPGCQARMSGSPPQRRSKR